MSNATPPPSGTARGRRALRHAETHVRPEGLAEGVGCHPAKMISHATRQPGDQIADGDEIGTARDRAGGSDASVIGSQPVLEPIARGNVVGIVGINGGVESGLAGMD